MKDLDEAILDKLNTSGVKDKLIAQVRAEVFHAVFKNSDNNENLDKRNVLRENAIINEIIREYMIFNGFQFSVSVFDAECQRRGNLETSNKSTFVPDRQSVAQFLNASIDNMTIETSEGKTVEVPLIYGILQEVKERSSQQEDNTSLPRNSS